jgi:hypothetical protein
VNRALDLVWPWRRSALIEIVVAAAILLGVAIGAGSQAALTTPVAPDAIQAWGGSAVPAIINLIDDVRTVQDGTAPGSTTSPSHLSQDADRLAEDLDAARALPPPPSALLAADWAQALRALTNAQHGLVSALARPTPASLGLARSRLEAATNSLLQIGQEIQADS